MRRQEKAIFAPLHESDAWVGPLTIRDRFWRFLGFTWAAPRPASVKLALEGLEMRDLPNNLMASDLVPDLSSTNTALTAPADDVTFNDSTDSSTVLSGLATAAPVDPTASVQQWSGQLPDSTVISLAGNAPESAAPLTPADMLFQSAFADPFANPYRSGSRGALPLPGPLRTVHDTLASYGSSLI